MVKANLESISSSVNDYMSAHYLVLNHEKTQVVWAGDANGTASSSPINVGGTMVAPSGIVDVLGVTFDNRLSPAPHLSSMLQSARSLAGASMRLSLHLRQRVLQQVVRALLVGKVGYACAILKPRLMSLDPVQRDLAAIQTAVNDCARAIVGSSRSDRLSVPSLLAQAGMPSINRLIVEQIAVETWKGMNYECNGSKIPIGQILCPSPPLHQSLSSQSDPLVLELLIASHPPQNSNVTPLLGTPTGFGITRPPLRSATTLSNARKAAKEIAALAPI